MQRILKSLFSCSTWLQTSQRIYSLCPTSPNNSSGQREDESGQSRMFSAALEGSYVRGCYSFVRLVAVLQPLVLMEWVEAPHCQKLWATWSLVNVRIHSLTWIPPRKMLLGHEILLWDLAMLLKSGNGIDTLAVQRYKEFKTKVLKGNVLVKAETLTATSGSTKQHSLWTYHQVLAWLGLELPPDMYGFHILDGKYRAIFTELPAAPDALLKPFFCNCKTDCNTGWCTCRKHNLPCTDMCGVCQGLGCRNTEPPSMTNWMFHVLLWWWQSLFILTDLEYHINFAYTNIIETWLFCELYHLACVQIIGISQKLSGFESLQFCTFSVTLDWHWHMLDMLYINIIRYLLLYWLIDHLYFRHRWRCTDI